MKIGDLFFSAQLDDKGLGLQAQKAGAKAGTAMGRAASSKLGTAIKQGVGIGAGIGAFSLLSGAIGKVTAYLGDAAQAYRDDEVSQARLRSSLQANIPAWDGQTRAIEEVLSARINLGFSDDEQRASLATLVARTHDSTEALRLQRIAMDLARFKGLELGAATDLLGKAFSGQVGALRKAGIAVDAHATAAEALAAVEKAVTGQAEAFANTIEGKLVIAEKKAEESSEKFGKQIARLQAEIMPLAADAIGSLADQVDALQTAFDKTVPPADRFAATVQGLRSSFLAALPFFDDLITGLEGASEKALEAEEAERHHGDALIGVRNAVVDVTEATEDAEEPARELGREFDYLGRAAAGAEAEVDKLTDQLTDHLFGEAERAGQRAEITKRIDELAAKLKKTANDRDAVIIAGQLAEERASLMELDLQIATMAGGTALEDLLARWRKQFGKTDTAAQGMIDTLAEAVRKQKMWAAISFGGLVFTGIPNPTRRHSGGPVEAGKPYNWKPDEELLITRQPGFVVPDMMSAGAGLAGLPSGGSASGSVTNVNVQLPGLLRAESPADVVRTLRHLSAYGTFGEER